MTRSGEPGENFFVARYSRDVLGRSQIGGIVHQQASQFQRELQSDVCRRHEPRADAGLYGRRVYRGHLDARHFRGRVGAPTSGRDGSTSHGGFTPSTRTWEKTSIRKWGSCRALICVEAKLHIEYNPRPGKWGIRMMDPMWHVMNITDQTGRLMSRRLHNMVGTTFDNGANFTVIYDRLFERIDNVFSVGGVPIDPGRYNFYAWNFSFRSDPSRRFFYQLKLLATDVLRREPDGPCP